MQVSNIFMVQMMESHYKAETGVSEVEVRLRGEPGPLLRCNHLCVGRHAARTNYNYTFPKSAPRVLHNCLP